MKSPSINIFRPRNGLDSPPGTETTLWAACLGPHGTDRARYRVLHARGPRRVRPWLGCPVTGSSSTEGRWEEMVFLHCAGPHPAATSPGTRQQGVREVPQPVTSPLRCSSTWRPLVVLSPDGASVSTGSGPASPRDEGWVRIHLTHCSFPRNRQKSELFFFT